MGKKAICKFCSLITENVYTCPHCKSRFCSVKCYRHTDHQSCSENFYKNWVENELGKSSTSDSGVSQKNMTFEEFMTAADRAENFNPGKDEGTSGDENDAEPLDSDDDDLSYLETVVQETSKQYYEIDEDDVDRRLIGMKIGTNVDELLSALSECERDAFEKFAHQMHIAEEQLEKSVFVKKSKS